MVWQFKSFLEIYRIVSNKALESADNPIKPTGGESISIQPSTDTSANTKSGNCCWAYSTCFLAVHNDQVVVVRNLLH